MERASSTAPSKHQRTAVAENLPGSRAPRRRGQDSKGAQRSGRGLAAQANAAQGALVAVNSSKTITIEVVLGALCETIGGVDGECVRIWISDDAGRELVGVHFYRGRAIVFSQGTHAIKTLSAPAHECGVLVTHKSGSAVFIKAAGVPRVRIVDGPGMDPKEN